MFQHLNRLRERRLKGLLGLFFHPNLFKSNSIRCFIADEVAKIVEWIF